MSFLAQGNATSQGVEEDILIPLLARLANISTLLDSPSGSGSGSGPTPTNGEGPPPSSSAANDAKSRARCRELLEKVRREMVQLERVFRRIDDAEKRIRYSFDPVEQHLDDALQHDVVSADAERIHASLLAVDAGVSSIKATIREAYNIPCECDGDDDGEAEAGPSQPQVCAPAPPGTATAMTMTNKIRHDPQMSHLRLAVGGLDERLRGCALCLAAFPEGAVIKKRLLLHWWVAEGFVRSADEGKSRFDELMAKGFVIPFTAPNAICRTVHRCTVRPWMRHLLLSVARRNGFLELNAGDVEFARRACLRGDKQAAGFSAALRAIYNVGQKYVELHERWFAGKKDLRVLQLGQWREFSSAQQIASPMDSHIEVSGVERFRDMESCKNLRYVSFRGISRIESLPSSIGKLRQLQVLDLRACHNLEELGQGIITKLDRLEYLDLSECHLLAGVPKGLAQLTRLEVFKGFVVANSNSRDFCHLNELTKLEKLRKLGIVIGKMAVPMEDEFLKLGEFRSLESLRISWGVLSLSSATCAAASPSPRRHSLATMKYALPPNLKKLDLHCFPFADFARWVRPTGVRKLYIRGGKLATFGEDEEEWGAEVLRLRLRFLSDLHCHQGGLRRLFRNLKPENTEVHECPNFIRGGMDRGKHETHGEGEAEETDACNDEI